MLRFVALLLTLLTGFSGLVYEVAWQKFLAVLLGSHSEATAAILGIFLGGLALGYALFGRLTARRMASAAAAGRPPRLLFDYGVIESAIGVYALAFPYAFRGVQALSLQLPRSSDGTGFAVDVLLTALLIGPPSVLMGGTIPILTQALSRGLADATRLHAFVYAFNTAGAFLGALAGGFWLVPWLGLESTVRAMGALNLAAGATFLALGRRVPAAAPAAVSAASEPAPGAPTGFAGFAAVALLSGFAAMTLQTTLVRLGGLAFGASHFTFSMVVAVFVLCIALGSFAVSALPRIPATLLVGSQGLLVVLLVALYPRLQDVAYWAHRLRSLFRDVDAAFHPFYFAAFAALLALLLLPVGISGATLPLLFHHLRRRVGDLGGMAGRLYSWNTLGSLLGALLGGYALLFWVDLHAVYRIAVAAVAVAATILAVQTLGLSRWLMPLLVLVPTLLGLWLLPAWSPARLATGLFRERQPEPMTFEGPEAFFAARRQPSVRYYSDDPAASVAVFGYEHEGREILSILTNGKPDGSIPYDYATMGMAAVLPALFAERCERAFVIGFGTGVTAGELASVGCRDVTVAEISKGVLTAAPLFDPHNQNVTQRDGIRLERGDAYRSLQRAEGRYDVIASEPSNPWVTGVEMLFSREFLIAARDRLAPGGVYAQWFHTYETDAETVELVLRTYASVFDHVAVWFALGPDLLLLGFQDDGGALDVERLERRSQQPEFAAALARCGITSFPALLAHELIPVDVLHAAALPGEVHTLLHPVLSYRAARAFFRGGQAALPVMLHPQAAEVGARNALMRRWAQRFGGSLPVAERSALVKELCRHRASECLTHLAAWRAEAPDSPELAEAFEAARPRVASLMEQGRLRRLVGFYRAEPSPDDKPLRAAGAARASGDFERFYLHAVPFERGALAALWARCRDRDGECARTRASVEARIGAIGASSPLPSAVQGAVEPRGG